MGRNNQAEEKCASAQPESWQNRGPITNLRLSKCQAQFIGNVLQLRGINSTKGAKLSQRQETPGLAGKHPGAGNYRSPDKIAKPSGGGGRSGSPFMHQRSPETQMARSTSLPHTGAPGQAITISGCDHSESHLEPPLSNIVSPERGPAQGSPEPPRRGV